MSSREPETIYTIKVHCEEFRSEVIALQRALRALDKLHYGIIQCDWCHLIAHETDPDNEFTTCSRCDCDVCIYCLGYDNLEVIRENDKVFCKDCE